MSDALNIPMYKKITNQIYQDISLGIYKQGDLLPTESDFIKRYNTSRTTVRKALSSLVEEGIIYRKAGKGSFVQKGFLKKRPQMLLKGSFSAILAVAKELNVKVLKYEYMLPTPDVKAKLQLGDDDRVLRVERLHFYNELPFLYSTNFLPENEGRLLSLCDFENFTVAELISTKCKQTLKEAIQTFNAVVADSQRSKSLNVPVGFPLLSIERISFSVENRPVNLFFGFFRSDSYIFSAVFSFEENINA